MKPIGAIGITIIEGTTKGAYKVRHRSANEVISKGLCGAFISKNPGLPLHKKCCGCAKERGQAALPDPETLNMLDYFRVESHFALRSGRSTLISSRSGRRACPRSYAQPKQVLRSLSWLFERFTVFI